MMIRAFQGKLRDYHMIPMSAEKAARLHAWLRVPGRQSVRVILDTVYPRWKALEDASAALFALVASYQTHEWDMQAEEMLQMEHHRQWLERQAAAREPLALEPPPVYPMTELERMMQEDYIVCDEVKQVDEAEERMTTQLGGMVLRDLEQEEEAPTRKSRRREEEEACYRPATRMMIMRSVADGKEVTTTVPWVPSKAMRGTRVQRAATMGGRNY